jgi:hypothetical protein
VGSPSASALRLRFYFSIENQRCIHCADSSHFHSSFITTRSIAMQSEGSEFVASGNPAHSMTPADVVERCSNCNSDLSAEDLDLESVAEYFNQEEVQRYWEEGAAGGCVFCRLVAAVCTDAGQRYRCYRSGIVRVVPTTDERYLLRLVNISPKLPRTVPRGVYATITVYLKGKASLVDRCVLQYQHHRFQPS